MSIWTNLGFRSSPYETSPIPPSEEGNRLLAGREDELRRLMTRLSSSTRHPTIEGENGVGKTSLVAIAGYRAMRAYSDGETEHLLIPVEARFQLQPPVDVGSIREAVWLAIARALVDHERFLRNAGRVLPDLTPLRDWLQRPMFVSREVGATLLGVGGNVAQGAAPNTSAGFTQVGLQSFLEECLRSCFPSDLDGFLFVLDNLELLQTSQTAREALEGLRDTVLSIHGVRWVLCGARGIVRSTVSSPRLEGRLGEPLEVHAVVDEVLPELIKRRIDVFRSSGQALAPVDSDGFKLIYEVLNSNLRNALKYSEDFSLWLVENHDARMPASDRLELLEVWLADQADRATADTAGVGNRAWEVFDGICAMGGSCSPGDFAEFGFTSQPNMRPHVRSLEEANLVQSSVDETDKRRKTISLTPRGWLVHFRRSSYRLPSGRTL